MISFFLPKSAWPAPFPQNRDELYPRYGSGAHSWILQTYLVLKETSIDCEITSEFPEKGVVVFHRSTVADNLIPNSEQLFVCVQADYSRHRYSQVHIVQNPRAVKENCFRNVDNWVRPGKDFFVRHWTQPSLIPRASSRGDQFKNIGFFGIVENLDEKLKSPVWEKALAEMGLHWKVCSRPEEWNNYSDIDTVVAIRRFDGLETSWKPATKLYNGWHAGVPVVVDPHSAYRAEKKSEKDFVEVDSVESLLNAIQKLQSDPKLRWQMIENGHHRAKETSVDSLIEDWLGIFRETDKMWNDWKNSGSLRRRFKALWKVQDNLEYAKSLVRSKLSKAG